MVIIFKNILYRSALLGYSCHSRFISKLNPFLNKFNQVRLVSSLCDADLSDFENLLNRPDVQKYLELVNHECDKIEKPNKEQAPVFELCSRIKSFRDELEHLKTLNAENDEDLQQLIDSEKKEFLQKIKQLNSKLIWCATPEEDDCDSVTFSVVPGLGGQEAKLFAEELFNMYLNYARFRGWEVSLVDTIKSQGGGVNKAEATIRGELVYKHLKYEAGIHRVQRVPSTEKTGRVQTSTCKINVIPDVQADEIVIDKKDLKIETKRSSGPGGQNVNKVESCVRVTYIPTGHVVECQVSRFQIENKALAIQKLKNILNQELNDEINSKAMEMKAEQGLTIKRSDKIRTYNFMQNRVTDHRINYTTHQIEKYMEGNEELNDMVKQLDANFKQEYLLRNINRMLRQGNVNALFKKNQN